MTGDSDKTLVERLRHCADHPRLTYPGAVATVLEAADRIILYKQQRDKLRQALAEISDITHRQQLPITYQVHQVAEAALTETIDHGEAKG